jgi:hypothetical protein
MAAAASSRPCDEIGCKSRPDIIGDHFRRAELRIPQSAHAGESLLLAWDVVGHAGEGLPGHHDVAGSDFGQRIGRIDAVVLDIRPRGMDIDNDR